MSTTVKVVTVCFLYPYFTFAFIVILALTVLLDMIMNTGVHQTKKLDNQMKAPVLHHISSSMAGIVTIRGFRKQEVFKRR